MIGLSVVQLLGERYGSKEERQEKEEVDSQRPPRKERSLNSRPRAGFDSVGSAPYLSHELTLSAGPVRSVVGALRRLALPEASGGRPPSRRQGALQRRPGVSGSRVAGGGALAACPRKYLCIGSVGMQERPGGDRRLEHGRPARRWRGPYSVSAALQAGRRLADGRPAAVPACRGQGLPRRAAGGGHRRRDAQAGRRCRRSCFSTVRGTTLRGGRAPGG